MQADTEIVVKISKEDAGAISITPVEKQRVRVRDLVAVIAGVTGKDASRVAAILARGVFVKGMSRLRWEGFDGSAVAAECLAGIPDPWPGRPFQLDEVSKIEIWQGRAALQLSMELARSRRWLRRQSFCAWLETQCQNESPRYERYDYELRADVFVMDVSTGQSAAILEAADLIADAGLRRALRQAAVSRLHFLAPRA